MVNVHPAVVHFPIALLTLYALLECVRFKKLTENKSWHAIKAFLLIIGVLSAFAALLSGNAIEDQFEGGSLDDIIDAHETWAITSITIFSVLALAYILPVIVPNKIIKNSATIITHRWPGSIIALTGLLAITITGALGGAMVHGPNVDPFVKFIHNILIE